MSPTRGEPSPRATALRIPACPPSPSWKAPGKKSSSLRDRRRISPRTFIRREDCTLGTVPDAPYADVIGPAAAEFRRSSSGEVGDGATSAVTGVTICGQRFPHGWNRSGDDLFLSIFKSSRDAPSTSFGGRGPSFINRKSRGCRSPLESAEDSAIGCGGKKAFPERGGLPAGGGVGNACLSEADERA